MAKTVPIELDKPRLLRFDINALSDAEEALGVGLGAALQQQAGIRTIRALLWAGLRWQDRGLTQERTGQLLQQFIEQNGSMDGIVSAITEAITACGLFGPNDPDPKNAAAEAAS